LPIEFIADCRLPISVGRLIKIGIGNGQSAIGNYRKHRSSQGVFD